MCAVRQWCGEDAKMRGCTFVLCSADGPGLYVRVAHDPHVRSYPTEKTVSRPICEVNLLRAGSVVRLETTCEALVVHITFFFASRPTRPCRRGGALKHPPCGPPYRPNALPPAVRPSSLVPRLQPLPRPSALGPRPSALSHHRGVLTIIARVGIAPRNRPASTGCFWRTPRP